MPQYNVTARKKLTMSREMLSKDKKNERKYDLKETFLVSESQTNKERSTDWISHLCQN